MIKTLIAVLLGLSVTVVAEARDLSDYPKTEGSSRRVEQASAEYDTFVILRACDTCSITFRHTYRNALIWADTDFGYHVGSAPSGTEGIEVFVSNGYFSHIATFKKGTTMHFDVLPFGGDGDGNDIGNIFAIIQRR